jgi:hypothetical protein
MLLTLYVSLDTDGPIFWNRIEETITVALRNANYPVSYVAGIDEDHNEDEEALDTSHRHPYDAA